MEKTSNLSAREVTLIGVMASPPFPNLTKACEQTGIPYSTASKWHCQPYFQAALIAAIEDTKSEVRREADKIFYAATRAAAANLMRKIASDDANTSLRASLAILERSLGKVPDRIADADGNSIPVGFAIDSARSRTDSEV